MVSSLPYHENEPQQSITNSWSYTIVKCCIMQICQLIMELLTGFLAKNITYQKKNTHVKIIDITNCKTCEKRLLDVEYMILVSYCYQDTKATALYESTDGPAGQPADNPPNSYGLGQYHQSCTPIAHLGVLTTRIANLDTAWFWPGPGHSALLQNCW